MKRSPKPLLACLLGLALLSCGVTAAPVAAQRTGRVHRHATARRQAHKRACRRRHSECGTDTGGTPASSPRTPRVPRRAPALPRTNRRGADTSTPAAPRRSPAEETAAVIAGVLAVPCANTELTPSAETLPLARDAVLCLINHVRAEHGLNPLAVNGHLEGAAEGHCAELISDNYFAHVSPGGETPVDRIRKTGYIPGPSVGYVIGENLAWGTYGLSTPQSIVAAWVASPGHLANILESQYRETGIGIVPAVPVSLGGGSPGATYAQEFGVIIH